MGCFRSSEGFSQAILCLEDFPRLILLLFGVSLTAHEFCNAVTEDASEMVPGWKVTKVVTHSWTERVALSPFSEDDAPRLLLDGMLDCRAKRRG